MGSSFQYECSDSKNCKGDCREGEANKKCLKSTVVLAESPVFSRVFTIIETRWDTGWDIDSESREKWGGGSPHWRGAFRL